MRSRDQPWRVDRLVPPHVDHGPPDRTQGRARSAFWRRCEAVECHFSPIGSMSIFSVIYGDRARRPDQVAPAGVGAFGGRGQPVLADDVEHDHLEPSCEPVCLPGRASRTPLSSVRPGTPLPLLAMNRQRALYPTFRRNASSTARRNEQLRPSEPGVVNECLIDGTDRDAADLRDKRWLRLLVTWTITPCGVGPAANGHRQFDDAVVLGAVQAVEAAAAARPMARASPPSGADKRRATLPSQSGAADPSDTPLVCGRWKWRWSTSRWNSPP